MLVHRVLTRPAMPFIGWSSLDRLARDLSAWGSDIPLHVEGGLHGDARFAALNIGTTPTSVEVYAFAPGVDAASLDVQVDQGVLTLTGERKAQAPADEARTGAAVRYQQDSERFEGRFVRRVALPDDADASRVEASYRDGVLRITVARREAPQPRRVAVN
jgi:HSP20 family protein